MMRLSSSGIYCMTTNNETEIHTSMDQACLHLTNTDNSYSLSLWGQSEECYKCSFWELATVPPGTNDSLVVNTTYNTLFEVMHDSEHLYSFKESFEEAGIYSIAFNRTTFISKELKTGDREFMPILYAVVFYSLLLAVWQLCLFLRNRMNSEDNAGERSRNSHVEDSVTTSSRYSDGSVRLRTRIASSASLSFTVPQATNIAQSANVPSKHSSRLNSLDVFRGLTIFFMIFVNYGGGSYYFFQHSPWNGLTVADLLFPWFMWIMGVSLVFSFQSQLRRKVARYIIIFRVLKRSIILFSLGLLINSISSNYMPNLRIPGVLQRFGLCYLITATLEALIMVSEPVQCETQRSATPMASTSVMSSDEQALLSDAEVPSTGFLRDVTSSWLQWLTVIIFISVQVSITYLLFVPGCPQGYIGPGGLSMNSTHENCTGGAAAYVDRLIFTSQHLYSGSTARKVYQNSLSHDPEGLLGSLTSLLMVQFGVAAGRILVIFKDHYARCCRFLLWGAASGIFAGILCGFCKEEGFVPVNKNLWSMSYVLCTACFAFFLFALIYTLVDWKQTWDGHPFKYAGLNSILLYVGHELCADLFPFSWSPVNNSHGEHLLVDLWGASLWLILAYVCHRRNIYVSI